MNLTNYFKAFLVNEVNLNPNRIKRLDERTEAITNVLKDSNLLNANYLDIIPQGSYAHKTIIKPVHETDEFDADILLYLKEFPEWEASDYVENIYQLFRENGTYKEMVSRKTRCVTIDYACDFHIDVVPFLERHNEKFVTNRHENSYELTNPEKYTEWLEERNRITNHNFVKVVRLIKYLRNYKRTFSIKSIVLNTILGEQVNNAALLENPNCYKDIPTTLYTIMKKLKVYLENNPNMPTILDPGGTGENFGDRWNQEKYANFRNKMIYYNDKITEAYEEEDLEKSLEKWQIVFGEEFKQPEIIPEKHQLTSNRSLNTSNNTEQQITDLEISLHLNPNFNVRLTGKVNQKPGYREFQLLSTGNNVGKGRTITFSIQRCNVPPPYKIYWKVLNRGEEAIKRDCIRGQIFEGGNIHTEPTSFRGSHFVECFIVKDSVCVARDRQIVNII